MKYFALVLAFFTSFTFTGQSVFNSEGASVTKADLETNYYEKDSTANALVIYEYGNSYIDKNSFKLKTEITKKVKIFNRNGFDKANLEIFLYNNKNKKEKVSDLRATTYNLENGSVTKTKLKNSEIFEEKYNENYTIVKSTFPNIKEGSVIIYSYTLESPFVFKYKGWSFQEDIPKLYSEYNTSIPGNYEYNIKLVGFLKLFHQDSNIRHNCLSVGNGGYANCTDTRYIMKDIPAFIEEDYMTTKSNYLSRIEYELKVFRGFDGRVDNITKNWKTTDKELKTDNNIGRQLGKSGGLKNLLSDSIINENDELKKASKILEYVQNNYTWNGKHNLFKDNSVKNLIKEKSGSASEINILLHNLLEENDINVKPVLISTRNNGLPTKLFPVISEFNYLIVAATINNEQYFLDATDEYLSFGEIPFKCLNHYGRLLDFKDASSWIDISDEKVSSRFYKAELSIDAEANISGIISSKSTGYHGLPLKRSYYSNSNQYLEYFKETYVNLDFLDHKVLSEGKTSYEFEEEFEIVYESDITANNIYLNPFLFKFFTENPFKLQERTYPIDFGYKDAYLYMLKLEIGDAYEILETPEDCVLKLPNNTGSLTFTTTVNENSVLLYFKFNFTQSYYEPQYYDSLKTFFGKIVDVQKNSLILLKKKQ